jgi:hypothetical protein
MAIAPSIATAVVHEVTEQIGGPLNAVGVDSVAARELQRGGHFVEAVEAQQRTRQIAVRRNELLVESERLPERGDSALVLTERSRCESEAVEGERFSWIGLRPLHGQIQRFVPRLFGITR